MSAWRRVDFTEVGKVPALAFKPDDESRAGERGERLAAIVGRYPLYATLGAPAPV